MNTQAIVDLVRQALMTAFWISLPILFVGFAIGIVISLVQIITSIQDPAFGSLPRLAGFLAGLLLFLPWMLMRLCTYTIQLFGDFGRFAR
ncbi:MAG: flagellar biosynthetic protein FliQ [Bryobacterales bacterium]|nr:flagellar biosynthetic protein FliQ [Bryobacterales bacterium]